MCTYLPCGPILPRHVPQARTPPPLLPPGMSTRSPRKAVMGRNYRGRGDPRARNAILIPRGGGGKRYQAIRYPWRIRLIADRRPQRRLIDPAIVRGANHPSPV